jgi:hypothetical protein
MPPSTAGRDACRHLFERVPSETPPEIRAADVSLVIFILCLDLVCSEKGFI